MFAVLNEKKKNRMNTCLCDGGGCYKGRRWKRVMMSYFRWWSTEELPDDVLVGELGSSFSPDLPCHSCRLAAG